MPRKGKHIPREAAQLAICLWGKEIPKEVNRVMEAVRAALHRPNKGQNVIAAFNNQLGKLKRYNTAEIQSTITWLQNPENRAQIASMGASGCIDIWISALQALLNGKTGLQAFEVGAGPKKKWSFPENHTLAARVEKLRRSKGLTAQKAINQVLVAANQPGKDDRNIRRELKKIRKLYPDDETLDKLAN